MDLDKDFLGLLICPKTKEKLVFRGDKLVSEKSNIEYIIKNNIPVLLEKEN